MIKIQNTNGKYSCNETNSMDQMCRTYLTRINHDLDIF